MTVKLSEIEISKSNPFQNCVLKRETIANDLSKFIKNSKKGFVMAINNKWGAGKTTFIKMWAQKMANDGFKTIYLNAWENDFYDDPLIPIMGEMKKDLESKEYTSLIEKAAKISAAVAPALVKGAVKYITKNEDIVKIAQDAAKGASKVFEKEVEDYNKKKDSLIEFRSSLQQIVQQKCGGKNLIVIIDELDRCRPDYAVELLEKVKHLFTVDNIIFILCIDKKQLGFAIQGRYGSSSIDTQEYLRRFINYEFTLPDPNPSDYFHFLYKSTLGKKKDEFFSRSVYECKEFPFIKSMTLRQLESFFFILDNSLPGDTLWNSDYVTTIIIFISIKINRPDVYEQVLNKKYSISDFHEYLDKYLGINESNYRNISPSELVDIQIYSLYVYACFYNTKDISREIIHDAKTFYQYINLSESSGKAVQIKDGIISLIKKDKPFDVIRLIESLNNFATNNNPATILTE